jgi:hydrogenase/urease accessory protein HupE
MKAWLAVAYWLLGWSLASAHPVAQGQLDVQWQSQAVLITARVSDEQIMVASTRISRADVATLDELWADHGRYLLAHLQLRATAAQPLRGALLGVRRASGNCVEYRLRYPLPAGVHELRLRQDLLNEIEYAPGNPWEATYIVNSHEARGKVQTLLLRSRNQELRLSQAELQGVGTLAWQFVQHGFQHILSGYDHLLFISALVLAAVSLRNLISVVATFTLAHSITLTLSALQLVRLPANVVEPMIAGSIVAVALSNILWPRSGGGWLRLATAFFFGLFHGLGFAGGLLDAAQAISGERIAVAIAGFSTGVECGHMLVVLPLFLVLYLIRRWLPAPAAGQLDAMIALRGGSALICAAGIFYLVTALQW